ncbi:hypothetical protein ASPCADRAFT_209558 [Aspergillus carbonarius ITEM 5010]|uniref:N-acetyltransferase domain-containing protein n=1 Tax=Aspergillus carbonarius (strain ITEM 5010) TaxID=602072 RepID=A0A1R3RGK2_ASPC5|nr:hypothetical protein ASPCADRAFT_209558 [Aspergillus carbonarius ITEM 5010]
MSLPTIPQTWHRDEFLISNDKTLLSIPSINAAFNSDDMYWAESFPDNVLQDVINNSFCLGLYTTASKTPKQIGFARLVTDNITFAYLTDVYVLPEYQGRGLGGWLLDCMAEVLAPLPYLRWTMLRTSTAKSRESYERRMGMRVLCNGDVKDGAVMMGKKGQGGRV